MVLFVPRPPLLCHPPRPLLIFRAKVGTAWILIMAGHRGNSVGPTNHEARPINSWRRTRGVGEGVPGECNGQCNRNVCTCTNFCHVFVFELYNGSEQGILLFFYVIFLNANTLLRKM